MAVPVQTLPLRDLEDLLALRTGCAGADAVVHLAARVHILRDSPPGREEAYRRTNVEGTHNVLKAAASAGVGHAVLISSVKAVGESNLRPWTEDQPPAPTDPYGQSKREMEDLAMEFGRDTGMRVSILRLPLVYGPGSTGNSKRLIALVDRGWPLPLGSIQNRRSMIFVENAVAAITALLETHSRVDGVFFASDGVDLSTPELIRTIAGALGRPARLIPVPVPLLRAVGKFGDWLQWLVPVPLTSDEVERLSGSLTVASGRLSALTGFTPPYSPQEGWKKTADWLRTCQDDA
jgi:UDP-glucose 4-epimerase